MTNVHKWDQSTRLLEKINKLFYKVHDSKVGKEYTPEQEKRLTQLRARSVSLNYYRIKLNQLSKVTK
jgi:hypothetical protein